MHISSTVTSRIRGQCSLLCGTAYIAQWVWSAWVSFVYEPDIGSLLVPFVNAAHLPQAFFVQSIYQRITLTGDAHHA